MCLAIPGQIMKIEDHAPADLSSDAALLYRQGTVNFGGILKSVSLAYLPEAEVGDYVIVHVGFALSIVDEEAALQTQADWAATSHRSIGRWRQENTSQ